MIEQSSTRQSPSSRVLSFSFAAVNAVMLANNATFPLRTETYKLPEERGTYSDIMYNLSRLSESELFEEQINAIYNSFMISQARLGAEFEAAIFSDIESLYEA